jgi:23S rRNA (cytosine1962-C5)-methyltransferase
MARIYTAHWKDYELIDAGNEKKLERWGKIITIRPDRNAYFPPVLSEAEWQSKAHFRFVAKDTTQGEWQHLKIGTPTEWQMSYDQLNFRIKLTRFKHVGLFPEQRCNWDFIKDKIQPAGRFLNLFGYTGGASVMARSLGTEVFHCDSVKQINTWAKENMEASKLEGIHWVLDDALKFAQRELKRENKYTGIIMDPPAFGLGTQKERWKIEQKFPELLNTALGLIKKNGFIIMNTYSPRLTEQKIKEITLELVKNKKVEISTLSIKSTTGKILDFGEVTRIY